MEPSNQEAAEELAELKHLQHQQLTAKIGIPGLQIEELHGELQGYVAYDCLTTHHTCIWADKPTVDLYLSCVISGAENGPGHVIWEAGIVLSHYLVNHRGKDSAVHACFMRYQLVG